MSRVRRIGTLALAVAIVLGAAAGCSSDDEEPTSSDRKTISFSEAPEGSEDLGLCRTYALDKMKGLIGGDEHFRRLPPAAIGKRGDAVTGESCAWERDDLDGNTAAMRIEVRNFGDDAEALGTAYQERLNAATSPVTVEDVGDAAFTTATDLNTTMQVRTGQYLLTLSSTASGELDPQSVETLAFLAGAGLDRLP